jgi:hypothetical protein
VYSGVTLTLSIQIQYFPLVLKLWIAARTLPACQEVMHSNPEIEYCKVTNFESTYARGWLAGYPPFHTYVTGDLVTSSIFESVRCPRKGPEYSFSSETV